MVTVERDSAIHETTLVALIDQAQREKSPDAFDGLYLLYADRIYRYLLIRLGDGEAAAEVTSQVFLQLIEKIGLYRLAPADNVAIFSAWLYRIAHNRMIDVIRKQSRTYTVPIEGAAQIPAAQPLTELVVAKLDQEQLLEKLQLLNEAQRQVILLRFIEELSIAETAQLMQKSEGAVKALQHRSLENLRRLLQEAH